jgi:hypothetical protein
VPTRDEIDRALAEIGSKPGRAQCWTLALEGQALDFLHILERMERDGERVTRSIAAEKFLELFEFEVSSSQISHHLVKRCSCKREREY